MNADPYSIAQLVDDVRQICATHNDDREIISRVRPLAQRAAELDDRWIEKRFFVVDPAQALAVIACTRMRTAKPFPVQMN